MDLVEELPMILCFSHDIPLLQTRTWLLEKLGCFVIPVTSASAFREELQANPIAIVVLCQSLAEEECLGADEFMNTHRPDAKLLLLIGTRVKYVPAQEHVKLASSAGPLAFLSTIQGMLSSRLDRGSLDSLFLRLPDELVDLQ